MTDRPWTIGSKLPGAVLVGAAVVMFAGVAIGFLAPSLREAPPFVTDDVKSAAAAIAANPTAWMWANGLILAAAIITALGLVPISLRFEGPSRPWAVLASAAFGLAASFEAIDRMISIQVTTWAAKRHPDPDVFTVWEAFDRFEAALGAAFAIVAFVAVGLYGVAMLRVSPRTGLGWVFVAAGVVGAVLESFGGGIPAFVFITTAGLGTASWQRGSAGAPRRIRGASTA